MCCLSPRIMSGNIKARLKSVLPRAKRPFFYLSFLSDTEPKGMEAPLIPAVRQVDPVQVDPVEADPAPAAPLARRPRKNRDN